MIAKMKHKSVFEVLGAQGEHELFGTPQLQVQAIRDLYTILKRIKGKRINKGNWKKSTTMGEVLTWIVEQINSQYADRFTRDGDFEIKRNKKYGFYLERYEEYEDIDRVFQPIACCFLPELCIQNTYLHDLFVTMVSILNRHAMVQMWDNGYFEYSLDGFADFVGNEAYTDMKPDDYVKANACLDCYEHGDAHNYLSVIRADTSSIKFFVKNLESYKPKNKGENALYKWMLRSIPLVTSRHNLQEYVQTLFYEEGTGVEPITMRDAITFVWEIEDGLYNHAFEYIECSANEAGVELPYHTYQITKNKDVKKEPDIFPVELSKFFIDGYGVIKDFQVHLTKNKRP